jgi:ABC-type lipoprotein release transport system permease subunit
LLSLPIVWYLHEYPIVLTGSMAKAYENYGMEPVMKTAFDIWIFIKQAIVIFIISTLLTVYPLWYIWQLRPVEAMRE